MNKSQIREAFSWKSAERLLIDVVLIELGLMISSCGTSLFYAASLGSSAMATFSDGLHLVIGITYGQANMLANLVLLFVLLLLNRRYINVGTVLCVFTIGLWVDLFNGLLAGFDIASASMLVRVLFTVLGTSMMGFGLGIYMAVNRGFGALEGIVKIVCAKTGMSMTVAKIIQDAVLVGMGMLLGATWGVGTLIGVFCTGPILHRSCKLFERVFAAHRAKAVRPD